jgi:hypothetical protein
VTLPAWGERAEGLVVIGCSARKAPAPAPARDLYQGELFRLAVAWAEARQRPWLVLSARHGLVEPDTELAPYDTTLATAAHRRAATALVRQQLAGRRHPQRITVLAGAAYLAVLRTAAPTVELDTPLQDLPARGLGHYKAWLIHTTNCTDNLDSLYLY